MRTIRERHQAYRSFGYVHQGLTHYHPAMPFGQKKNILEYLFSSVWSQFKYHPSGNLKFNYFGIFQSLKLLILMEKSFQFLLS